MGAPYDRGHLHALLEVGGDGKHVSALLEEHEQVAAEFLQDELATNTPFPYHLGNAAGAEILEALGLVVVGRVPLLLDLILNVDAAQLYDSVYAAC